MTPAKKGDVVLVEIVQSLTVLFGGTTKTKAYQFGIVNRASLGGAITKMTVGNIPMKPAGPTWVCPDVDPTILDDVKIRGDFETVQEAAEFARQYRTGRKMHA